ncbi:hypothetical protein SRHO_G00023590 [Serrasalmus rhombeus]
MMPLLCSHRHNSMQMTTVYAEKHEQLCICDANLHASVCPVRLWMNSSVKSLLLLMLNVESIAVELHADSLDRSDFHLIGLITASL